MSSPIDERIDSLDVDKQAIFQHTVHTDLQWLGCLGAIGNIGDIPWRVLAIENNRSLIIAQNIHFVKAYHEEPCNITWEHCSLRRWLNSDFYNTLPCHIKSRVVDVYNQNPANPLRGTPGGNSTTDKVFLLSLGEANRYFVSRSDGAAKWNDEVHWWWLRSPGHSAFCAADVLTDGNINPVGGLASFGYGGVRPSLWIDVSKLP